MFYPDDPDELRSLLATCFEDGRGVDDRSVTMPKALIAPHAGYIYSGPIAASAYSELEAARGAVTKVILLGPSHRVPLDGLAVPSADALATPLGLIAVDPDLRQRALAMPGVVTADGPHAAEHSLEVHLPFVQHVLGEVSVLPLVVGRASMETVAAVLDAVWGGPETLIVVSTDLSHYHDYATAKRLDRATADAVEAGRPDMIDDLDACGAYPLRGLLHLAGRRGVTATVIDLRSSGDTAGPRDRVVGYGAFAVN
jgi:AmmeMemoRadiSam system protein B